MPFSSLTSITFIVLWKSYMIFFSLEKINIFGSDYSTFACPLISRLCYNLISVCDDLFSTVVGFHVFKMRTSVQLSFIYFFLFSSAFNSHLGLSLAGEEPVFAPVDTVLASEEFLFPT